MSLALLWRLKVADFIMMNRYKEISVVALGFVLANLLFASACYAGGEFTYGASFRLREEIWEKVIDLGILNVKNESYFRLRTSLWGQWQPNEDVSAYIKFTNESKYYLSSFSPYNKDFRWDEVVIDNLHLDAKSIFGLPLDVVIGRQDLFYGDGLLIADGTPATGDRTRYFNALKASWRIDQNHSVDFLYISDPKTDVYLPSLHPPNEGPSYRNHKRILTVSDERALVIYGRNTLGGGFVLEPYYIYKKEGQISQSIPELHLHTVGGRAVCRADPWELKGEFAHQFGKYYGGRRRLGNGGYLSVGRSLEDVLWKPYFDAGFVYLSGDRPDTATNESWDPLFSRWPGWSKLFVYTLSRETGIIGYWTNLLFFRANARLNFTPVTALSLWYNYLMADQKTNITGPSAPMFSNDGKGRGHLPQVMLSYKFTENLDGYLLFEYFIPGNFYSGRADNAYYLRWQLQMKI